MLALFYFANATVNSYFDKLPEESITGLTQKFEVAICPHYLSLIGFSTVHGLQIEVVALSFSSGSFMFGYFV